MRPSATSNGRCEKNNCLSKDQENWVRPTPLVYNTKNYPTPSTPWEAELARAQERAKSLFTEHRRARFDYTDPPWV